MKTLTSKKIQEFTSTKLFDEKIISHADPSWPKISIVTPSYNQGEFLERTIMSVLNQNYPNLEYIIIDGGSTDGSMDIIKKYEKHLAHWISEPDNGQAHALNKGFRLAKGEISAWLNSDDIYLPNTLVEVSTYFTQNPDTEFVFGNTVFVNAGDEVIGDVRFTKFSLRSYIYKSFGLHQPSSFWKSELFNEMGGLREHFSFCMDTDFFMRMAKSGKDFHFFDKYLTCFRITETQKSSRISHIGLKERKEIIKEIFDIDINYDSFKLKLLKFIYQTRRFLLYLLHGKINYVFAIFLRRIKQGKPLIRT
ncbi:glycosyltransferase family 2 protein [Acidobacteriota bacterium]